MSQKIGLISENAACMHLQKSGLRLLTSNYSSRFGEIDLIMQEGQTIVFVEVRARSSYKYGNALESISFQKQQKILKTATHFMGSKHWHKDYTARFDVVCFQGASFEINWIKNAFGVN